MLRELRWKRRGRHWLFFLFVVLPMLCVFPYIRGVNNPNEFVRVFTVMAMVEGRTFRIDDQVQTWGWVNDMAKVKSKEDGRDHYFMVKGPAILYPGLPGYFVFSKIVAPVLGKKYPGKPAQRAAFTDEERRWWLQMSTWAMRLSGSQLPCLLFLLWFERYLRDFTRDSAIRYTAVAAAGLGTNFLAYVNMFASHSQYASVAFLAFALTERELRLSRGDLGAMRPSKAFLAGFFTSACVAFEYHALFGTLILSLFATFVYFRPLRFVAHLLGKLGMQRMKELVPRGTSFSPKCLLAFALGGFVNIPHVMYFHWRAYGNPFTPGHQVLETAQFAAEHKQGLWGILWPSWDHVVNLAVNPGFGFFGMSPFMWLGLLAVVYLVLSPGKPSASERNHLRVITLVWFAVCAVCMGVNAGFIEWRAGWTIGPRYLVVCAPFFAFGAACALERFAQKGRARRALARGVGGGLCLASILTIGAVSITYDTLPTEIQRPLAQFTIPLARVAMVPHHVGEWFGWNTPTFWYVVCAAMLLTPIVATLTSQPSETTGRQLARYGSFALAFAIGMVPAFWPTPDRSKLFVVHPSSAGLAQGWEPPGRDRIALLREEAERYGSRGIGPCLWYRIADMERTISQDAAAARDEARARGGLTRAQCPKSRWY